MKKLLCLVISLCAVSLYASPIVFQSPTLGGTNTWAGSNLFHTLQVTNDLNVTLGNIVLSSGYVQAGNGFIGDGSQISNIQGVSITGDVGSYDFPVGSIYSSYLFGDGSNISNIWINQINGVGSAAGFNTTGDPYANDPNLILTSDAVFTLVTTGSSTGGLVTSTNGNTIQIKYGTQAQVNNYVPLPEEPVYATDTQAFTIGDGSTIGGIVPNNGKWNYANRLFTVGYLTNVISNIVFGDNSIALGGSSNGNTVIGGGNTSGVAYSGTIGKIGLSPYTRGYFLTDTTATSNDFQAGDIVIIRDSLYPGPVQPWFKTTIASTNLTGGSYYLQLTDTIPFSYGTLYAYRKDLGNNNLIVGSNSVGSGNSITVGNSLTNTGSNSVVIGNHSSSVAANAIVLGNNIKADKQGELVIGYAAKTQYSVVCLTGTTINTENIELSTDGLTASGNSQYDSAGNLATNRYWLNNNTSYDCIIKVTARESGGQSAHWQRQVLVRNSSGTCTLDNVQVIGTDYNPQSWSLIIQIDPFGPPVLEIICSGATFTPIQWMATVTANEVYR